MAMNDQITGNVTGKIKFTIDRASWNNLDKFQKKLTSVKKQMSNMDKTINVNAVVKSVEKVTKAQVKADNAVVQSQIRSSKVMEKHLKQQQNNMLRMQKDYVKKQEQMVKGANANAGMSGRLSWMFPSGGVSTKASSTLFAQMLKDEEKDIKNYEKRREQVLSTRARLNAARRKRKAKGVNAVSMYEQRVQAFMTVKENQIKNEAIRKGYAGTQRETDNLAKLQQARLDNFDSVYGNIGQFRANVNGVVNGMHTMQRAAAANKITFASLRGELVQLTAAYGAFAVVQNVAQTGMEMEALRASAKVFAKDDAGVAEHMSFIADEANRIGINFQEAAKSFTKFSISTKGKFDRSTQRALFSGISEYAAVLQLDAESQTRLFKSIQQTADKGLYA